MSSDSQVRASNAIADPLQVDANGHPRTAGVTADRKLMVEATVTATAESTAEATAAAPSYVEGQDAPISQDLSGNLRTIQPGVTGSKTAGTAAASALLTGGVYNTVAPAPTNGQQVALQLDSAGNLKTSSTVTPQTSATFTPTQVTVPATANGIAVLAANASRKGATVFNPGPSTVYVQQGATGVTTSNGFGIAAGASYNIDAPLYLGALYGIVASGTQIVTVAELT